MHIVRAGCNNCKNRRVKCDEMRPQCNKCVKSGRFCDGYPAYKRSTLIAIPIAPRPENNASISPSTQTSTLPMIRSRTPQLSIRKPRHPYKASIVQHSLTIYTPCEPLLNTREGQYFQVFRAHTSSEVSGEFNSEFWTRTVLQESGSNTSVRHTIVALGALYKTLNEASKLPSDSPSNHTLVRNHYSFALLCYGKALMRAREALKTSGTYSPRAMLISILLCTCFESFVGDYKTASALIQRGLGLLEEQRGQIQQPLIHGSIDAIGNDLIQAFTRLALQAKSTDMALHFANPYRIRLNPVQVSASPPTSQPSLNIPPILSYRSEIPEVFTSSQEARSALDYLCEWILRIDEVLSSDFGQGRDEHFLPTSIKELGADCRTQLAQWSAAFEPLLNARSREGISLVEIIGIDVLKMVQLMTLVQFLMGFSTSEMDFDNFIPQFNEICELAEDVLTREKLGMGQGESKTGFVSSQTRYPAGNSSLQASFSLDLGVIPPLFLVATRCRERELRRDAIRMLLSSPRREGLWDSTLCGRVAEWIMQIEEEGLPPLHVGVPTRAESVAADERVTIKEILFDLQRREATIRCGTRGVKEGVSDPRARETHIRW